MKKNYSLKLIAATVALFAAGFSANAQTVNLTAVNDSRQIQYVAPQKVTAVNNKALVACGVDTVNYPQRKATGFGFTGVNTNQLPSVGQYYNGTNTDSITVSGFDFLAVKQDTTKGATMVVVAEMYLAGTDSFATGMPLGSDTIIVDTSFFGGNLVALTKSATFQNPVTVGQPYVLVVSVLDTLNLLVVRNSFANGDGGFEDLSSVFFNGGWTSGLSIAFGGAAFNADFLFHPYVSYDLNTDFSINPDSLGMPNQTVSIVNTSSDIINDRMYNLAVALGLGVLNHTYNFGNGGGDVRITDSNVVYSTLQNYTITLNDTLIQYNFNRCASAETKILAPAVNPLAPLVISEINYNPAEGGTDSTEYIEIYHNGTTTLQLNGYTFGEGVDYLFGINDSITSGQYFVIAVDSSGFRNTYGFDADAIWTSGGLSNGGEDISILDAMNRTVDSVDFDDNMPWPSGSLAGQPDGGGASIELMNVNFDNNVASNWVASTAPVNGGIMVNGNPVTGTPGNAFTTSITTVNRTANNFKMYPNPTNGLVTVELPANLLNERVQVFAISGKLVAEELVINEKVNFNFSDLDSGVYFIRVGNLTEKLIINK